MSVISSVIKNEGISTLYTGLSAGLLRQATYTTTRLGIYTWLFETFSTDGTPAEVALIRMTSDGSLPVEKRRNYKEEGVTTLW